MIRWITPELGTAPCRALKPSDYVVVDVRDLVDGEGNSEDIVWRKISAVAEALTAGRKVIACCDYGISRSNSIAIAALAKWRDISFSEAQRTVLEQTGEREMRLDVLNDVRRTFERRHRSKASDPTKAKVLVTGASGSAGRAVVSACAESMLTEAISSADLDLAREPALLDLLVKERGIRNLVHLAHPRRSGTSGSLGTSITMLKNVIDVCVENDLRLIYVSSWEVFGASRASHFQADEDTPRSPRSMVGLAKSLGEDLLATAGERLIFTIVRPARLYGGSLRSPRVLWNIAEQCLTGAPVVLHKFHNGLALLDLLHVKDFAGGIRAVLDRGVNGILHFGSGQPVSTEEVVGKVIRISGARCSVEAQPIDGWAANVSLNNKRSASLLAWKATQVLDDGLAEIVKALKTTKR